MTTNCKMCDSKLPIGKVRCLSCGGWNLSDEREKNSNSTLYKIISVDEAREIVESPRLETGLIDEATGGGLCYGNLYLLAGWPGSGKTTLIQQLLHLVSHGCFIGYEQHAKKFAKNADRLGLQLNHIDILSRPNIELLPIIIKQYLDDHPNCQLLAIDSISAIFKNGDDEAVNFCEFLVELAGAYDVIIIGIIHVNKSGEPAGTEKMLHTSDCNLEFSVNGNYREIKAIKNREGPAFVSNYFEMTDKGLCSIKSRE